MWNLWMCKQSSLKRLLYLPATLIGRKMQVFAIRFSTLYVSRWTDLWNSSIELRYMFEIPNTMTSHSPASSQTSSAWTVSCIWLQLCKKPPFRQFRSHWKKVFRIILSFDRVAEAELWKSCLKLMGMQHNLPGNWRFMLRIYIVDLSNEITAKRAEINYILI